MISRFLDRAGQVNQGPELKCSDITLGGSPPIVQLVSTTAIVTLINQVSLGSGANNRIGRSVMAKSVRIRGGFFPTGNAGSALGEFLRVALVYDRQTSSSAPIYSDIWKCVDTSGNTSSGTFDMPNLDNEDRFLILRDWRLQLPATNAAGIANAGALQDPAQIMSIDEYVDLEGLPTIYSGATSGGTATILSGGLFLVSLGSVAAASASANFNYTARYRFYDV